MLPAPARLRRRKDFSLVVRQGRRAGRGTLVAHYLPPDPADGGPRPAARVGFVVGRTVGGSVVRHRTVRRLRHLVRDRLALLPAGSRLVIRVLPPAAEADSADLGRELDAALRRLGLGGSGAVAAPGLDPSTVSDTAPVTRDLLGRPEGGRVTVEATTSSRRHPAAGTAPAPARGPVAPAVTGVGR